jgi:hypothetical protein
MNHLGEQHNRRPVLVSAIHVSNSLCKSESTHSQSEHELVPLIEHAEVQDDASEHSALACSQ